MKTNKPQKGTNISIDTVVDLLKLIPKWLATLMITMLFLLFIFFSIVDKLGLERVGDIIITNINSMAKDDKIRSKIIETFLGINEETIKELRQTSMKIVQKVDNEKEKLIEQIYRIDEHQHLLDKESERILDLENKTATQTFKILQNTEGIEDNKEQIKKLKNTTIKIKNQLKRIKDNR